MSEVSASRSLVIVGAGMAAAYLLNELSTRQHDWSITVIGEEPRACYNRVLLSSLLAGEVQSADLDMLDAENGMRFLTDTRVEKILPDEQQLLCDDGARLQYDALVLATGAVPSVPDINIRFGDSVLAVRTESDVDALQALSRSVGGTRAVVLGGGLLGLEAAHGLHELGFNTQVLHRNPVLMNRQLDATGGEYLRRRLLRRGLAIRTGVSPTQVNYHDSGAVKNIMLDDGDTVPCDVLVLATGITPRVDIADHAGINCERGILVNAHLQTSGNAIYSLGECCQYGDTTFGLVAPIRAQAQVLANHLAGVSCKAESPTFANAHWPAQLKISGIDIFQAGELDDTAEQINLCDDDNGVYRRLIIRDDRLVGAVLVGDASSSTWYADLIAQQTPISALRSGLMFGLDIAQRQVA